MSQISDTTQPDQNNSNGKLKYFSNDRVFEQPLFRYYNQDVSFDKTSSILYKPDGKISNTNIDNKTQYTRNIIEEPQKKPVSNFDDKYFPSIIKKSVSFRSSTNGDPIDCSKKVEIENEFKIPDYSKTREIPEFKSTDGRTFKLTNDRRKNLDHSEYVRSGSMTNSGFGNINNFSTIKYGESTRDINGASRNKEIDRFHFTFRDYQNPIYGSNSYPQDTRYLNKKF